MYSIRHIRREYTVSNTEPDLISGQLMVNTDTINPIVATTSYDSYGATGGPSGSQRSDEQPGVNRNTGDAGNNSTIPRVTFSAPDITSQHSLRSDRTCATETTIAKTIDHNINRIFANNATTIELRRAVTNTVDGGLYTSIQSTSTPPPSNDQHTTSTQGQRKAPSVRTASSSDSESDKRRDHDRTRSTNSTGIPDPTSARRRSRTSRVNEMTDRYYHNALALSTQMDEDISRFSNERIQSRIRQLTEEMKICTRNFPLIQETDGTLLSYHHHNYLLDAATSYLKQLNIKLLKATELHDDTTEPIIINREMMASADATASNKTDFEQQLLLFPYPFGFTEPPRSWDQNIAHEFAHLAILPLMEFTGDTGTTPWELFWTEWRTRVHMIPESLFPMSAKFAFLINQLKGDPAKHIIGLSKHAAQTAYKLLIQRLHAAYANKESRIPYTPQGMHRIQPTANTIESIHTWLIELQMAASDLTRDGQSIERINAMCYANLYNGLSPHLQTEVNEIWYKNRQDYPSIFRFPLIISHIRNKLMEMKSTELQVDTVPITQPTKLNVRYGKRARVTISDTPKQVSEPAPAEIAVPAPITNYRSTPGYYIKPHNRCPFHLVDPITVTHDVRDCKLPRAYRLANILASKRCTVCLELGHKAKDCIIEYGCRKCARRHSTSICQEYVDKNTGHNIISDMDRYMPHGIYAKSQADKNPKEIDDSTAYMTEEEYEAHLSKEYRRLTSLNKR